MKQKKTFKVFNILFLGGAKRISIGKKFIESGKKLKLKVNLFTYELEKNVPFSIIGNVILGKKWNDKSVVNHLQRIIKQKKISLVIASVDQATFLLPKLNALLKKNIAISCNLKTLNTVFDKEKIKIFCNNNNIKTIKTSKTFPLIIKPKNGSASKNIYIVKNKTDFNSIKQSKSLKNFIFQKYMKGIEYSVDAYVSSRGKIVGCIPRQRNKVFQGEVILTKVVKNSKLVNITKQVIKSFNIFGPVNIQFIKDKNDYLLMDINPRLGGGVLTSIKAGFDITKIILQDILDLKINKNINYKKIIMSRYMTEVYYEINN